MLQKSYNCCGSNTCRNSIQSFCIGEFCRSSFFSDKFEGKCAQLKPPNPPQKRNPFLNLQTPLDVARLEICYALWNGYKCTNQNCVRSHDIDQLQKHGMEAHNNPQLSNIRIIVNQVLTNIYNFRLYQQQKNLSRTAILRNTLATQNNNTKNKIINGFYNELLKVPIPGYPRYPVHVSTHPPPHFRSHKLTSIVENPENVGYSRYNRRRLNTV